MANCDSEDLFSGPEEEPYAMQTSSGGSDLDSEPEPVYRTDDPDLISMLFSIHKRPRKSPAISSEADVGHTSTSRKAPVITAASSVADKPSTAAKLSTPLPGKEKKQKRGRGETMSPSTPARFPAPLPGRDNQQERGRGKTMSRHTLGDISVALGALTQSVNKVVKRLERQEVRLQAMEQKLSSSASSDSSGASKKVPAVVKVR